MADEILHGWNAISEFLSCDVRTAKRWEQLRGLPVHRTRRTPGEGRANVYALASELKAWLPPVNTLPEPLSAVEHPQHKENSPPISSIDAPRASRKVARLRWRRLVLPLIGVASAIVVLMLLGTGSDFPAKKNSDKLNHPLPSASPRGMQASELYLRGSYLFEQRTPEALQQAKLDFQSVIATNPDFAPAYAGLAKTYDLLCEYSTLPATQAYPLARQSALHAIALDRGLPDAHAALGYEQFFGEWDALRAEAEFKQAIALDANSSLAHLWYGSMLLHQRRFAESLSQLNQAQLLKPDSAGVLGLRAYALGLSGKRDQAMDVVQDILTRVPDSAPLHFTLAQLCLQQPRDIPLYLDQMRRFAELRRSEQMLAVVRAGDLAYRRADEQAMWQAMLEVERQFHPDTNHPTYFIAALEAAQGMNDFALRDLHLLLRDHNEMMVGIEIDALLSPIRKDPRFSSIVSQVGLPPLPSPIETATENH
jgi:Tfp pilus assembly protein PilF